MSKASSERPDFVEGAPLRIHSRVDWNSRYNKGWAYGKSPNEFLVHAVTEFVTDVPALPPLHVLSLGEGQGRNVAYLAGLGHSCVAVDSAATAALCTQRLAREKGVHPLISTCTEDLESYEPGENRFDVIVSIFCMLPAERRRELHRKCTKALRSGGLIIIECFSREQDMSATHSGIMDRPEKPRSWRMGPPPDCLVDCGELSADFEDLEIVLARNISRELREGKFHCGTGAVTQFVARKLSSRRGGRPEAAGYKAAVEEVFSEHDQPKSLISTPWSTDSLPEDNCERPRDSILAHASSFLRVACSYASEVSWCRYCWCSLADCICSRLREPPAPVALKEGEGETLQLRWIYLIHPNEFLRSTSSAKVAAQYLGEIGPTARGSEVLVFGCRAHAIRLKQLLESDEEFPCILFPEGDRVVNKGAPSIRAHISSASSISVSALLSRCRDASTRRVNVIVPDGSWANAAALVTEIRNKYPFTKVPSVALDDGIVSAHVSPLIEALKAGQGLGRISTLEACALFLREVGLADDADGLLEALDPLVEYVSSAFSGAGAVPVSKEGLASPSPLELELWTDSLQRFVETTPELSVPRGLRMCVICGENLATPARMQQHLTGRRHCMAVARGFLSDHSKNGVEQRIPLPDDERLRQVLEKYSTSVLAVHVAEPPDVAMVSLKEYLQANRLHGDTDKDHNKKGKSNPSVLAIPLSKGERALQEAPAPSVSAELPTVLRRRQVLCFDPSVFDLYGAAAALLGRLTDVGRFKDVSCMSLENYELHTDVFRSFKARQLVYRAVSVDERFLSLYEQVVQEVCCPHIKQLLADSGGGEREMGGEGAHEEALRFYYQYPPSLRLQGGPSVEFGRAHRDLEYGHQFGEINFWLPLTDLTLTKTTLWSESAPFLGDYQPACISLGEVLMFHGSVCRHYAPPNPSSFTRVSIDFRIGVDRYFDPAWELHSARGKHGRKLFCL